jgi:hypothetical protein
LEKGLLVGEFLLPSGQNNDESNLFQRLEEKSLLIYTLMEPVAQRVKRFLEDSCKSVTVHLSHDKGGNDRLEKWVKNDDLIVMVTASAKHAATGFIEANLPKGKPLVRVNQKGVSGMLRAIKVHLEESFRYPK